MAHDLDFPTIEIFNPPDLFHGPRPHLDAADDGAITPRWGENPSLGTVGQGSSAPPPAQRLISFDAGASSP